MYPQRPAVVESTGEVDGLGLKRNKVKISAVVLPDKVDPRQGSILLRDSNGTFIFMLKVRPSIYIIFASTVLGETLHITTYDTAYLAPDSNHQHFSSSIAQNVRNHKANKVRL